MKEKLRSYDYFLCWLFFLIILLPATVGQDEVMSHATKSVLSPREMISLRGSWEKCCWLGNDLCETDCIGTLKIVAYDYRWCITIYPGAPCSMDPPQNIIACDYLDCLIPGCHLCGPSSISPITVKHCNGYPCEMD